MNDHNFTGNRYQAAEILQVSDDKYGVFLQPAQYLKGGHL